MPPPRKPDEHPIQKPAEGIVDNVRNAGKGIAELWEGTQDSQKFGHIIAEIGKPFRFAQKVDLEDRAYKFLATRMNIVDIYPCNYAQSFLYNNNYSMFKYGIGYKDAMEKYNSLCKFYLGDDPKQQYPHALRIYLTDDTAVTDSIQTTYKDNFFQTLADKMSNAAQMFVSLQQSISSNRVNQMVDEIIKSTKPAESMKEGLNTMFGLSESSIGGKIAGGLVNALVTGASIVLKGSKLSLPKIWDSTNYHPSFSLSTKLYSPYGSPVAVKRFIIKPLTYILLMALPQSSDMISYNRPFAVTVRSWGTSFLTLASISNITLQRGGPDSVFNIYKQPLTININIEFESIVNGCFSYDPSVPGGNVNVSESDKAYEKQAFPGSEIKLPLSESQHIDGSVLPTVVPTLGGIIRSLQPIVIQDLTQEFGVAKSTREDTMVGGNITATLAGIVGVGQFSAFNSWFNSITGAANGQGGIGTKLFGGITDFLGKAIPGIGTVLQTAGHFTGSFSSLLNQVTLGKFGNTAFGKTLGRFGTLMQGGNRLATSIFGALSGVQRGIDFTGNALGSLLNWILK